MPEFKHKSITKLHELYLEHKGSMGKGLSSMSLMWRAISPSIPSILSSLDENEEMLEKTKDFLEMILKAFREDAKKLLTVKSEKTPDA